LVASVGISAEAISQVGDNYGEALPFCSSKVSFWRASSAVKVPERCTLPSVICKGIGLRTAANEAEAVQLVITPHEELREVKVRLGPLPRSASGEELPVVAFDILRLSDDSVKKDEDLLLPQKKDVALNLQPSVNHSFWIRAKPPKGTKKGVYRSEIWVECGYGDKNYEMLKIPFAVEVFGFSMTDYYTCQSAFNCSLEIYRYHNAKRGDAKAALKDFYYSFMGENHISPYYPAGKLTIGCFFPGLKSGCDFSQLTARFNWERFDKHIDNALRTYKFNAFCLSLVNLKSFLGYSRGDEGYEILLGKYLAGVEAHLKEKGWINKAYVYAYGEDQLSEMDDFEMMKKAKIAVSANDSAEILDSVCTYHTDDVAKFLLELE
jgi:hypothetical protein